MEKTTIKKWFKKISLSTFIIVIISYYYVDFQIKSLWGAHTQVVNSEQFSVPQIKIVITNVNILSVDGKKIIPNQTVVIDKGVITAVGSDIKADKSVRSIDGSGKYLIPGLTDSHVHLWQSPNDLLLYIANGVTQIRELNGSDEQLKWREQIKLGRVGPKMFVASSRINSNGMISAWFQKWAMKITSINAFNSAKNLVEGFKSQGYDAIKTYTFINNRDYWALSKATQEAGIPLLGHIPINMTLDKVWQSNQKELAHIEEIVKALIREFDDSILNNPEKFLAFVSQRSNTVASRLVKNKIAVISTLWLVESFAKQKEDLDRTLKQVELAYVNPGITERSPITSRAMGWLPDSNIYRLPEGITAETKTSYIKYWKTYAKAHQIMLKAMVQKHVIILAGTDANVPVTVPGFSLHNELISLTQSGMTNTQALLSATTDPAHWMKQKSGTIKKGYRADIVMLKKNPLENIENTKSIEFVIANGRLYERRLLDAMLKAVKDANNESRTVDISKYH
jgi:hypothetical protein